MTSVACIKCALLSSLLSLSILSGEIYAGDTETPDRFGDNELGIAINPHCSTRIKSAALTANGMKPSGQTASTAKWDLEIFTNPEAKTWMLAGKEKGGNDSRMLCDLDTGTGDYTQQKWYREYFK